MSRFAFSAVVAAGVSAAAALWVLAQPAATQPAPDAAAATQPSGVVSKTLQPPSPGAKEADTLFVRYTGKLADGTIFDSTDSQGGRLFRFRLGDGSVIKGWEQGVAGMQVGEKRELVIPPALAYGPDGRPPAIPPDATLTFEIELMGLVRLPAENR